jgi:hypothetical protein
LLAELSPSRTVKRAQRVCSGDAFVEEHRVGRTSRYARIPYSMVSMVDDVRGKAERKYENE